MADTDRTTYNTYVRENPTTIRETRETSSGGVAFIVGGLVVAVGLIAWFVWGDPAPVTGVTEGDSTSITIETPANEPAATAPSSTVPAPAPEAAAPVETAPAAPAAPAPAAPAQP